MSFDVSQLKVEKGIPVPPKYSAAGGGKWAMLIASMAVGDSVLVPKPCVPHLHTAANKAGKKGVARKVDGDTARFWLIERPAE